MRCGHRARSFWLNRETGEKVALCRRHLSEAQARERAWEREQEGVG